VRIIDDHSMRGAPLGQFNLRDTTVWEDSSEFASDTNQSKYRRKVLSFYEFDIIM
jgi:hypothetical protein